MMATPTFNGLKRGGRGSSSPGVFLQYSQNVSALAIHFKFTMCLHSNILRNISHDIIIFKNLIHFTNASLSTTFLEMVISFKKFSETER